MFYKLCFVLLSMASVLDCQTLSGGTLLANSSSSTTAPPHGKVVVCYVATWAVYRPAPGSFAIEDLDPSLCTHLVYSFAGLDESTMGIKSLDPWQDLEKDYGKAGFKRLVGLKDRYPHLKVTIAIGGWNEGSLKYSKMAETAENRAKFIRSVLLFLDNHKFDGLDLDWEYPAKRDGRPMDKANYVSLVKELKESFEPHGYILTAALGAGKETMEAAYELSKLSRYLDFIHMMCYDYHGTWDGVAGSNAPLRGDNTTVMNTVLSVEYTIKYMIDHGASPYKLVLGLPLYGRNFILQDPGVEKVVFGKTPVKNVGFKGPWTREAGFMGYNEICAELTNSSSSWEKFWDDVSFTPYLREGERVITYDNGRSIAMKVKMAMDYNLGGLMVWSIDTDDFKGDCERETDVYTDFIQRYSDVERDPLFVEALRNLHLSVNQSAERPGSTKPHRHYTLTNGSPQLTLPKSEFSNYHLMRTINDATTLALEEKRINEEMDRIASTNEIDDRDDKKNGSNRVEAVFLVTSFIVLLGLFMKLERY